MTGSTFCVANKKKCRGTVGLKQNLDVDFTLETFMSFCRSRFLMKH